MSAESDVFSKDPLVRCTANAGLAIKLLLKMGIRPTSVEIGDNGHEVAILHLRYEDFVRYVQEDGDRLYLDGLDRRGVRVSPLGPEGLEDRHRRSLMADFGLYRLMTVTPPRAGMICRSRADLAMRYFAVRRRNTRVDMDLINWDPGKDPEPWLVSIGQVQQ